MKASEGLKVKKAVMDEEEQDKEEAAHEEDPPGTSGDGSGAKDGSMEWDAKDGSMEWEAYFTTPPDLQNPQQSVSCRG
jgi:hypothetical protein